MECTGSTTTLGAVGARALVLADTACKAVVLATAPFADGAADGFYIEAIETVISIGVVDDAIIEACCIRGSTPHHAIVRLRCANGARIRIDRNIRTGCAGSIAARSIAGALHAAHSAVVVAGQRIDLATVRLALVAVAGACHAGIDADRVNAGGLHALVRLRARSSASTTVSNVGRAVYLAPVDGGVIAVVVARLALLVAGTTDTRANCVIP